MRSSRAILSLACLFVAAAHLPARGDTPALLVSCANGFDGFNAIGKYNLDGSPINPSLITGMHTAFSIATSGSDLFATNINGGTIDQYSTSGAVLNRPLITLNRPDAIAISGSNLYVIYNDGTTIGQYTTAGAPVNPSLITGLSGATSLAVSGSNIWVTNFTAGTIGKYTTSGGTLNSSLVSGLSNPNGIAVAGTDLFEVNVGSGTIGEYDLSGSPINPSLVSGLNNGPGPIIVNGSDLYVANNGGGTSGAGTVGEYTTAGLTVNATLIGGLYEPYSLAIAPDTAIPEPASISLLLLAGASLLIRPRQPRPR